MDERKISIVAIGRSPSDIEAGCIGILSKYSATGNVELIITGGRSMSSTAERCKKLGASHVSFIDNFNKSSVTQENVNALRSIIEKVDPSLIILPFPETSMKQMDVLGHSSLLASRGIKNILLYETSKNKKFLPNIFFSVKSENSSPQLMSLMKNSQINKRKKSLTRFYSNEMKKNEIIEAFKSYRLMLLDVSELA